MRAMYPWFLILWTAHIISHSIWDFDVCRRFLEKQDSTERIHSHFGVNILIHSTKLHIIIIYFEPPVRQYGICCRRCHEHVWNICCCEAIVFRENDKPSVAHCRWAIYSLFSGTPHRLRRKCEGTWFFYFGGNTHKLFLISCSQSFHLTPKTLKDGEKHWRMVRSRNEDDIVMSYN